MMILRGAVVFRRFLLIIVVVVVWTRKISMVSSRKHYPHPWGFWTNTATAAAAAVSAPSLHVPIANDETIRSILKDIRSALSSSSSPPASSSSSTTTSTTSQQRSASNSTAKSRPLDYSIFRGQGSALRNLPLQQRQWIERFDKSVAALVLLVLHGSLSESSEASSCSLLLDSAHEVVLGVRPNNIRDAEFAATHPGQTSWMQEHPLSDLDDWIHSIIHRREGDAIGEGNHTGWENAKYWAAGGPKQLYSNRSTTDNDTENNNTEHHVIAQKLARVARQRAPLCVEAGVVTTRPITQHLILAGNNGQDDDGDNNNKKQQIVAIPANCWDPFCFINLLSSMFSSSSCSSSRSALRQQEERQREEELNILLQVELDLLLKHAAAKATNVMASTNQE
jgi:hypothetical protein